MQPRVSSSEPWLAENAQSGIESFTCCYKLRVGVKDIQLVMNMVIDVGGRKFLGYQI